MAFTALDLYRAPAVMPDVGRLASQPYGTQGDAGVLRAYIWQRLLDSIAANGSTFLEYLAVTYYIPELIGGVLGALVGAAVAAEVGGVVNVITSGFSLVGSANIFVSVDRHHRRLPARREGVDRRHRPRRGQAGARLVEPRVGHAARPISDAGQPWALGLVAADTNPTESHQVVATGYDDLGPGKVKLHLYDNCEDTFHVGVPRELAVVRPHRRSLRRHRGERGRSGRRTGHHLRGLLAGRPAAAADQPAAVVIRAAPRRPSDRSPSIGKPAETRSSQDRSMPDPSRSVHDAVAPAHAPDGHSPRSVDDPATTFTRWEQGAWVLAASFHLVGSGPLFGDGLRAHRSIAEAGRPGDRRRGTSRRRSRVRRGHPLADAQGQR